VRDVELDGGKVDFTSKVPVSSGKGWFTAESEISSLPQGVAVIATITPGDKSRGNWATKEAALKALGINEEWMDK